MKNIWKVADKGHICPIYTEFKIKNKKMKHLIEDKQAVKKKEQRNTNYSEEK